MAGGQGRIGGRASRSTTSSNTFKNTGVKNSEVKPLVLIMQELSEDSEFLAKTSGRVVRSRMPC